jgi:hypothetical protein
MLSLVSGVKAYDFSLQLFPSNVGVSSILAVRSGYISGSGAALDFRPFEWFSAYCKWSTAVGRPVSMAQQAQGAFGNLWFCPIPNAGYEAFFDAVGLPVNLADDTTPDAIPFPWSDAVPFYAAWLCMMNAQRQADADSFFGRYEQIMMRLARMGATPSELPDNVPMDRGLRQQGG